MENYELCEKLVEKTGVSFSDAKSALERSNWDMLDAVILLEKEGKVSSSSANYKSESSDNSERKEKEKKRCENKEARKNFISKCKAFLSKNRIIAYNELGKQVIDLPIWLAVVIVCCTFWISIVAILISFSDGWQYKFVGPELGKDAVNNASAKVSSIFCKDKKSNTVDAEFTEKTEENEK